MNGTAREPGWHGAAAPTTRGEGTRSNRARAEAVAAARSRGARRGAVTAGVAGPHRGRGGRDDREERGARK